MAHSGLRLKPVKGTSFRYPGAISSTSTVKEQRESVGRWHSDYQKCRKKTLERPGYSPDPAEELIAFPRPLLVRREIRCPFMKTQTQLPTPWSLRLPDVAPPQTHTKVTAQYVQGDWRPWQEKRCYKKFRMTCRPTMIICRRS